MSLIRQSVQNEELVHRTRADILSRIEDYWVLEIDRNLAGCIALHPYPEEGKAELACLYVSRTRENAGFGRKLMTFVEDLARKEGFKEMFALSTQAFVYLQQKGGFHEADPDALPAARREKYEAQRPALQGADQGVDAARHAGLGLRLVRRSAASLFWSPRVLPRTEK